MEAVGTHEMIAAAAVVGVEQTACYACLIMVFCERSRKYVPQIILLSPDCILIVHRAVEQPSAVRSYSERSSSDVERVCFPCSFARSTDLVLVSGGLLCLMRSVGADLLELK